LERLGSEGENPHRVVVPNYDDDNIREFVLIFIYFIETFYSL